MCQINMILMYLVLIYTFTKMMMMGMLQEKLYSLNEPLGLIEVNMMDIQVFFVSYLIFGAMVGSFLNVLIYRLPIMLANLSSRSE
ncbi:hypothetical protein YPPY54_0994, partial [Yersinia pestis PY-54]